MGWDPCCDKPGLKKGPWTPEEDEKLTTYMEAHGHCSWRALPKQAGLARCGKSCRLRWTNYLRPGIKRGNFAAQEEDYIIHLHSILGNRWSTIATHLPGRTDNEIKNHWNTRLRKRLLKMGIDPTTHRPWPPHLQPPQQLPHMPAPSHTPPAVPSMQNLLLSLLQPKAATDVNDPTNHAATPHDPSALLKYLLLDVPSYTASAAAAPLPASPTIDPSLLAAAETRLLLDCLKLSSTSHLAENHSPDQQLNQLVTRLLLIKLLQQQQTTSSSAAHVGGHAAPLTFLAPEASGTTNKLPSRQHMFADLQHMSTNQRVCNQGLHPMMGDSQWPHVQDAGTTVQAASHYAPPIFPATTRGCGSSHTNGEGIVAGNSLNLLSATNSSSPYQQRLLQAFPFLADMMIEPCSSTAAADGLSSNQLCQVSAAPPIPSNTTPSSLSLPCPQLPPIWPTLYNHATTIGTPLLGDMPTTSIAWEELLVRGAGDSELNSSSSTGNTSSSSTLSSGSHAALAPGTPSSNHLNVQDYWSNLLNIISHNSNNHP